jgi:hypothetical protein
MESVIRTIYSVYLQTCKLSNARFEIIENTTLNEKFNILPMQTLQDGETPALNYLTIGNGGHKYVDNLGAPAIKEVFHNPQHAALYNHLPFVIREPNNDLSDQEILNYRLRVPITIAGNQYIAYYMKKIDSSVSKPTIVNIHVEDDTTKATFYYPDPSVLSPIPPNTHANITDDYADYIATVDAVNFYLSVDELTELRNAYTILYGVNEEPIISEIGLCSGVDRIANREVTGINVPYTEAIAVQMNFFINVYFVVQDFIGNVPGPIDRMIEIGGMEPIIKY